MFKRNLKMAAFIAAVGATTFVVKKLSENEELKAKVKEEGKKVVDGTKELTKAVSKATTETAKELKAKFEQDNPELVNKIKETSTTVIEKGRAVKSRLKAVCEEAFETDEVVQTEYELNEDEINPEDLTAESLADKENSTEESKGE